VGWVAGARLTSATSAGRGSGSLASATMTYDQLEDAIHEVQGRTDHPSA
jgi:NAD(P)H-dependent flavin oxidoreductase YrpB (nitropropane dioxygenase family)